MSAGAIAGIVVGIAAGVLLLVGGVILGRKWYYG